MAATERDGQKLHLGSALALLSVDELAAIVRQDVLGLLDRSRRRHRNQRVVFERIAIRRQLDFQRKLLTDVGLGLAQADFGKWLGRRLQPHDLRPIDASNRRRRHDNLGRTFDRLLEGKRAAVRFAETLRRRFLCADEAGVR